MRIGDKATYAGTAYPWAAPLRVLRSVAGRQVEIKGVVRDYRTLKEGEVLATDQVIFSLTDADGFRCSAPDARPGDFEEPVLSEIEGIPPAVPGGVSNARLNVDSRCLSVIC